VFGQLNVGKLSGARPLDGLVELSVLPQILRYMRMLIRWQKVMLNEMPRFVVYFVKNDFKPTGLGEPGLSHLLHKAMQYLPPRENVLETYRLNLCRCKFVS